jgi:hypothetical protein
MSGQAGIGTYKPFGGPGPGSLTFSALRPRSYQREVKIPENSWLSDKRTDYFRDLPEISRVPLWRFLKLEEEIRGLINRILYRSLFTSPLLNALNEGIARLRQPGNMKSPIHLKVAGLEQSPFWLGVLPGVGADGSVAQDNYYLEYRSPSLLKRVSRVQIPVIFRNNRLGLPQADQNTRNHFQIRLLPPLEIPKSGSFINLYMKSSNPGPDFHGATLSGGVSKNTGDIADIGIEHPLDTLEGAVLLLTELFNRKRF